MSLAPITEPGRVTFGLALEELKDIALKREDSLMLRDAMWLAMDYERSGWAEQDLGPAGDILLQLKFWRMERISRP